MVLNSLLIIDCISKKGKLTDFVKHCEVLDNTIIEAQDKAISNQIRAN